MTYICPNCLANPATITSDHQCANCGVTLILLDNLIRDREEQIWIYMAIDNSWHRYRLP